MKDEPVVEQVPKGAVLNARLRQFLLHPPDHRAAAPTTVPCQRAAWRLLQVKVAHGFGLVKDFLNLQSPPTCGCVELYDLPDARSQQCHAQRRED